MSLELDTLVIHAGEHEPRLNGAVRMPIFQSAMFEHDDNPLRYIRYNNTPNQTVLNRKLAMLEGAEDALVTGSGMTAISGALLSVLKPGDHLLVQDSLYGGTHSFVTTLMADLDISVTFFDAHASDTWSQHLRPHTRAIYVESITNPLLHVCDLEGIIGFARANQLVSLIDNTFATPYNYRAVEAGFDLSLHSATKYLNGHSDIVAGAILGRGDLVRKAGKTLKHLGGALDPHACFLLHRGLQTFALRMRQHNRNAAELARYFASHPAVRRVYFPGLPTHRQHKRATRLFAGYGGMVALELHGGTRAAQACIRKLKIPIFAPSLGGVESLITRPAISSHAGLSPGERATTGIRDDLIRISVGIEAASDLKRDFNRALSRRPVQSGQTQVRPT